MQVDTVIENVIIPVSSEDDTNEVDDTVLLTLSDTTTTSLIPAETTTTSLSPFKTTSLIPSTKVPSSYNRNSNWIAFVIASIFIFLIVLIALYNIFIRKKK